MNPFLPRKMPLDIPERPIKGLPPVRLADSYENEWSQVHVSEDFAGALGRVGIELPRSSGPTLRQIRRFFRLGKRATLEEVVLVTSKEAGITDEEAAGPRWEIVGLAGATEPHKRKLVLGLSGAERGVPDVPEGLIGGDQVAAWWLYRRALRAENRDATSLRRQQIYGTVGGTFLVAGFSYATFFGSFAWAFSRLFGKGRRARERDAAATAKQVSGYLTKDINRVLHGLVHTPTE